LKSRISGLQTPSNNTILLYFPFPPPNSNFAFQFGPNWNRESEGRQPPSNSTINPHFFFLEKKGFWPSNWPRSIWIKFKSGFQDFQPHQRTRSFKHTHTRIYIYIYIYVYIYICIYIYIFAPTILSPLLQKPSLCTSIYIIGAKMISAVCMYTRSFHTHRYDTYHLGAFFYTVCSMTWSFYTGMEPTILAPILQKTSIWYWVELQPTATWMPVTLWQVLFTF